GLIAMWGDKLDRAVKSIVADTAGEYLYFQHRSLRPVRRSFVILDQSARAAEQVAFEIEGFVRAGGRIAPHADDKACRVVMLIRLATQVEFSGLIICGSIGQAIPRRIAVNHFLELNYSDWIKSICALGEGAYRAMQLVVIGTERPA